MRDVERLAEAVKARRLQLGDLTQADVTQRGGPSTETLRLIENAKQQSFSSRTLARLEQALMWLPGTVLRILDDKAGNTIEDELTACWVSVDNEGRQFTRVRLQDHTPYGAVISIRPIGQAAEKDEAAEITAITNSHVFGTAHANLGGLTATAGGARGIGQAHNPTVVVTSDPHAVTVDKLFRPGGAGLAQATHSAGILAADLSQLERTPRVARALDLAQQVFKLLLDEQVDPKGDV